MKVERNLCKSTHTVFVDSSDDDNEPSLKKLRYDSTKSDDDNSDQKKGPSTKDDSEIGSVVKRSKSDSAKKRQKNSSHAVDQNQESSSEDCQMVLVKTNHSAVKHNETELKCPLCKEFRSCVVSTLRAHLRRNHSTTLGLTGFFLRCDCGHESQSDFHLRECKIANYTLIRRGEGPLQTYNDAKVTPQCIMCEIYPRTAHGYAAHLVVHHETTLKANLRYLICSCGHKIKSRDVSPSHKKKCDGRNFTLHNSDEDLSTPNAS